MKCHTLIVGIFAEFLHINSEDLVTVIGKITLQFARSDVVCTRDGTMPPRWRQSVAGLRSFKDMTLLLCNKAVQSYWQELISDPSPLNRSLSDCSSLYPR